MVRYWTVHNILLDLDSCCCHKLRWLSMAKKPWKESSSQSNMVRAWHREIIWKLKVVLLSQKKIIFCMGKKIKINSRVRCRCTHKQRTHTYAWFLSCECIWWYALLYEIFKCEQPNEAHSFQDDVLESGHKVYQMIKIALWKAEFSVIVVIFD